MRSPRIEGNRDALAFRIRADFLHAFEVRERVAQFAHALIAIITLGRDLDRLEDLVVGGVVQVVRIGGVHHLRLRARVGHWPLMARRMQIVVARRASQL